MKLKRSLAVLLIMATVLALVPVASLATVLPGNTSKVDYDNTDSGRYTIEIDLTNQIITVYENGSNSIVIQGLCTTGGPKTPTSRGKYPVGDLKERFGYFVAYGQYAQYWTQVVRGIYIHSVMYDKKNTTSMSRSAYNNLGKACSHGCVRVLPEVAQWIYYNCPPGTMCNVTDKIPENEELRKALRAAMPSYSKYKQPTDTKDAPVEVPACVLFDETPLRTGFSASKDKTLMKLNVNDKVWLLQIGETWCKVRTMKGKLGYIQTQYLMFEPDAAIQTVELYKSSGTTYIYAKTTTSSTKLVKIPKGSVVNVTGAAERSGWYTAEYNGMTGYARAKYVKLTSETVFPQVYIAPDPTAPADDGGWVAPNAPSVPAPTAQPSTVSGGNGWGN